MPAWDGTQRLRYWPTSLEPYASDGVRVISCRRGWLVAGEGDQLPVRVVTGRPRREASSTSAMCATAGASPPSAASDEAIWRLQPGFAETTRRAPVARSEAAVRHDLRTAHRGTR